MKQARIKVITIAILCGCILAIGLALETSSSHQATVLKEKNNMIHDDCILLINGKESLNDRFVSINIEKKYAMIPLVPVLEELGFPVKWTGKYTAVIDVYGEEYFLDTKNITLCKGIDGPNELMIPPGATHGVLTNWIDEVLTIDNDTLVWFISHLIGARISINYTTSTISIYFSK